VLDPIVVVLAIALASRQPLASAGAERPWRPSASTAAPRSAAPRAQRPKNRKG
jgi:hypothetical protein